MWNCTHFKHLTDEQLRHVDIYFLATKIICSLSTLNILKTAEDQGYCPEGLLMELENDLKRNCGPSTADRGDHIFM